MPPGPADNLTAPLSPEGPAEPAALLAESLHRLERLMGLDHASVAVTLVALAMVRLQSILAQDPFALVDPDRAPDSEESPEPLLRRALRILEAAPGPDNLESLLGALDGLAQVQQASGALEGAVATLERHLQIEESGRPADDGAKSYQMVKTLTRLITLHLQMGSPQRATRMAERALSLEGAALYASVIAAELEWMAEQCDGLGAFDLSVRLLERAVALQEAASGKDSAEVASFLPRLADAYFRVAAPDRAMATLLRARQIREAAGPDSPETGEVLCKIALYHQAAGAHDRVEPLLVRALAIAEGTFGPAAPPVAYLLSRLAAHCEDRGDPERARTLMERAIAIPEPAPERAIIRLVRLSRLVAAGGTEGDRSAAQALLDRAQSLLASLPPLVQTTVQVRCTVARALLQGGRGDQALAVLQRSLLLSEKVLGEMGRGLGEPAYATLLSRLSEEEFQIYALAQQEPTPAAARLALTAALLRKGRLATEVADSHRVVLRDSQGPGHKRAVEQLRALRSRLAGTALAGAGALPPEDHAGRLQILSRQIDLLEARLAFSATPLRTPQPGSGGEEILAQVAARLPPGGALIEVVAFPLCEADSPAERPRFGKGHYLALVLRPEGQGDGPVGIADLGPAVEIEATIARLRAALSQPGAPYLEPAQALHAQIMGPLLPLLGEKRDLFLSLDGHLCLVPFAALHDGTAFLGDGYRLSYLNSGLDLLRFASDAPAALGVTILADPAFEEDPLSPGAAAGLNPKPEVPLGLVQPRYAPLPGTRREAEALRGLFPGARLLLGREASEGALLGLRAPGILHLATHGMFLSDSAGTVAAGRGFVEESAPPPSNPLLRSVLVLAGAGRARGEESAVAEGDGLVTALEVAGMDLCGTQLVVLSACETGRGEVTYSQGVYGLRRAFLTAGAETVVMSLWQVSDAATEELMVGYYRRLLAGEDRAGALQAAARELRAHRPHPYFWAPFLVVGRGDALRGLVTAAGS